MRIIQEAEPGTFQQGVVQWAPKGKVVRSLPAIGWQEMLDSAPQGDTLIPSKSPYCPCCLNNYYQVRVRQADTTQEPPLPDHIREAVEDSIRRPSRFRPAFAYGVVFRQIEPSGCYPKLWDTSEMLEMRATAGAIVIALDNCAFDLAPAELPDHPHSKIAWWLASKSLIPGVFLAARRCSKKLLSTPVREQHVHTRCEGSNDQGVSRCHLAGHYVQNFVTRGR